MVAGETIVFTSDAIGSPETFFITYILETDEGLDAGRYETNVTFLVAER